MSGPQLILANAVSPEVMGDPPPAYVAKMYAGPPRKVWRMFAGDVLISPYPVPAHMRAYACEVLNQNPESLEVIVPPGSATLLAERVLGDASVLETVRAACARRPEIGLEPFVLDASALRLADTLGIPLDRYRAFGGRPPQAALDAVHRYNAKSGFRAWAASAGAPVLPGVRAESAGDLVASARSLAVPAVIVKIDRGSNGFGNTVFATDEGGLAELAAWAAALVPAQGGYIVEEALAATSSPSAEFEVLDSGPRLVNVCDQRCVANAWVGMTIPPFELAADVQRTFAECGMRFGEHLHALGYRGIFDVDGVFDGTRFGVTETNLRTTGGTHMDIILRRLYGDGYTERWRIVADSIAAPPGEPFADVLARLRSAGLTVERPGASGAIGRVFLRAEEPCGITAGRHDVRAGGMISHAELVGLLSSDPAVLALTGHSDGIDLAISLRAFLCPFTADAAEPSGAEKQPPCRIEGRCTKFPVRPTAQAAAAKGWLVPVSAIRARIAAIFSCSIVKVDDGVIDPALGLGATIVRDADVDVLISTWREERETADGAMLNPLIDDLSRGVPAGEAVAAYNRSALARRTGTTLALLGDPAFALEDQPAYPALPAPVYRPLPAEDERGSAEGDVALLLAMAGDPAVAAADSSACRALTELLRSDDRRDADVESALVRLLGGVFRIEDYFGVHGVPTAPSEETPCVMCGAPARSYDVRFNALGARPRRIVRCASCMESSNLPAAWDTVPDPSRLTEGWIGLRRVPHGAHVHQTVMGYYEAIEYAEPWPLGDDGQAAQAAPLYVPAHGGLLYCKLFIVRGIEWASFGFKYRRLPDGTFWSSALVR